VPWYLWLYLALLGAVPLYSSVGSIFEEETPELSDVVTYLIYTAVLLCFAAYVRPGFAEALGGWLWLLIVGGGLACAVLAYGTWGDVVGARKGAGDADEAEAPGPAEVELVSPLAGKTLDLDAGNPPMTPDEQAEVGKAIMTMFSPAASTGDRLEGLAKLGETMPDDEEEETSWLDSFQVLAFSLLGVPAVISGVLAALR